MCCCIQEGSCQNFNPRTQSKVGVRFNTLQRKGIVGTQVVVTCADQVRLLAAPSMALPQNATTLAALSASDTAPPCAQIQLNS